MTAAAIGIDIGGTQIKAAAVDGAGAVVGQLQHPTPQQRPELIDAVRSLVAELPSTRRVGVSSPGLAARDGRSIAWMRGRMQCVEGLVWSDALDRPVPVMNDAHAALWGEAWVGAAAGAADAVLLTLGTGVGGAVMCDGRVLRGHLGRAGHLGHLCLDIHGLPDIVNTPGSLEDMIGNHTVAARSGGRFASTRALVEAHRRGDAEAQRVWLRSVRALACGVASIINAVDPQVVVIGGGIAQAGEALFAPLAQCLDEVEWRPTGRGVRIAPAALGDMAGAIGSARAAMTECSA